MLAPLKDRSILEKLDVEASTVEEGDVFSPEASELADLRRALKESRGRLRRSAWDSTRQICALHGQINHLESLCRSYEARLGRYASGVAMIEIGQELMRLTENNERLKNVAHRVLALEKQLTSALAAKELLSHECDRLAALLRADQSLTRMHGATLSYEE